MASVGMRPDPACTAREDAETERLFGEYSDRIFAFCLRRRGSRSEAEDAVQLTFLYALRALRRGVVPENESAWLHAIAKNVCLSQHRSATRRGRVSDDVGVDSLSAPTPDEDTHLLVGLRDALGSIPERQRRALLLREWHGLAPREIAAQLGMSAPATNALLTRARHSLAQALTAPGRAVLGLAPLLYDLRSYVKSLLGGASAKVAVTAVAVVGAGVGGGVAAERSLGKESTDPPITVSTADPGAADGSSSAASPASGGATATIVSASGGGSAAPSSRARDARSPLVGPASPEFISEPFAPPRGGYPSPAPEGPPEAPAPPTPEPPVTVPLDLPSLPGIELPTDLLPPVEPPPVELPPVELPPVELPPVELPSVEPPPVELPPEVDLPPVEPPPLPLLPLP